MATTRNRKKRKGTKKASPKRRRPKRATKPKAARKRTAKAKPRARAKPRTRAPRPSPRAMAADTGAGPATDDLTAKVMNALRRRAYDPNDAVLLEVLTAVARGYRRGSGAAPPWLRFDVNQALADGIVERFETGDRSPGPDRPVHRPQVRSTVVSNLELLGLATSTGDPEREVLTTLCLGSWDPATMTNAERDGVATFIVPWYRDGR